MMKHLLFLLAFSAGIPLAGAQSITQSVIGSAGGHVTAGSITVSWTAGETVTTTVSAGGIFLTQGFQQPRANQRLFPEAEITDATCRNSNDGTAKITLGGGFAPYTFTWEPNVSTSDSASGLAPGTYRVVITDTYDVTDTIEFSIGIANDVDCELHVYNAISPNGDGINDEWIIDNIQTYKENNIRIFNRWGDKVWENSNYDNSNVVWKGDNQQGQVLPEGTYFYILTIPSRQLTGWVEITR